MAASWVDTLIGLTEARTPGSSSSSYSDTRSDMDLRGNAQGV